MPDGEAAIRPAMWMILMATVLDIMAMGIVMPVLPVLIQDLTGSLKAASLWTGIIGSLWAVMQLLCAPLIGSLSDRYGRRPSPAFIRPTMERSSQLSVLRAETGE